MSFFPHNYHIASPGRMNVEGPCCFSKTSIPLTLLPQKCQSARDSTVNTEHSSATFVNEVFSSHLIIVKKPVKSVRGGL